MKTTLLDQMIAVLGDVPPGCPTVNGFHPSEIDTEDRDAPIIKVFLENALEFNRATREAAMFPKPDAAGKGDNPALTAIKQCLEQKAEIDAHYHPQGIFVEVDFRDGFVVNLRYSSPRKRWNPETRRPFSSTILV